MHLATLLMLLLLLFTSNLFISSFDKANKSQIRMIRKSQVYLLIHHNLIF